MDKSKIMQALSEADELAESIKTLKDAFDALREEGGKVKLIVRTKSGRCDCTTELSEKTSEKCLTILVASYNERLATLSKDVESYISGKMEV